MKDDAHVARCALALNMMGKLQDCHERAILQGIKLPVVFIFDLRDEYAREVCRQVADESEINEALSIAKEHGAVPAPTWFIPADLAARLVADPGTELEKAITEPPDRPGTFNVVVVAEGGLTVVPMDARQLARRSRPTSKRRMKCSHRATKVTESDPLVVEFTSWRRLNDMSSSVGNSSQELLQLAKQ